MHCYYCGEELTDTNSSDEHIIPNALGGRLKAKILCERCNNSFGHGCDADLAQNMLPFSNLVNHHRDKGTIPDIVCEIDGIKVRRDAATKQYNGLDVKFKKDGDTVSYDMRAIGPNAKEKLIKKNREIVERIGKKRGWDKDKIEQQITAFEGRVTAGTTDVKNPVIAFSVAIGGKGSYLSCLKTAINFYTYKNRNIAHIADAINILKAQDDSVFNIADMFFPATFYPTDTICHTLYLKGDSANKLLLCFISFYNVFQTVIILNNNYTGEDFEDRYCYDIWNEKEKVFDRSISLTSAQIMQIFDKSTESHNKKMESFKDAMCGFLQYFVVNKDLLQNAAPTFTRQILDTAAEIAKQPDILTPDQLIERIMATTLPLREGSFKFFKDKDIKAGAEMAKDVIHREYIRQKVWHSLMHHLSNIASRVVSESFIRNGMKQDFLDWDAMKNSIIDILEKSNFNDERFDALLPEIVPQVISHVDNLLDTLKNIVLPELASKISPT